MSSYSVPAASEVIVYAVSLDSDEGPEVMGLVRTFRCQGKNPTQTSSQAMGWLVSLGSSSVNFGQGHLHVLA